MNANTVVPSPDSTEAEEKKTVVCNPARSGGRQDATFHDFMTDKGQKQKYLQLKSGGKAKKQDLDTFLDAMFKTAKERFSFVYQDGKNEVEDEKIKQKIEKWYYNQKPNLSRIISNFAKQLDKHLAILSKACDEAVSLGLDSTKLQEVNKRYEQFISAAIQQNQLPSEQKDKNEKGIGTFDTKDSIRKYSADAKQGTTIPSEVVGSLAQSIDGITLQTHNTTEAINRKLDIVRATDPSSWKTSAFTPILGKRLKFLKSTLNDSGQYYGMLNEAGQPNGFGVAAYFTGNFFFGQWKKGRRVAGYYVHKYEYDTLDDRKLIQRPYPIIYKGAWNEKGNTLDDYWLYFGGDWVSSNGTNNGSGSGRKRAREDQEPELEEVFDRKVYPLPDTLQF
ncbi:unnamed protein product [Cylindrotheca closterium]|uniref:Uncharacterized protein n=1 Tax=Cylindrotheca closterium TaxID=2856 RepID=A0AAD2JHH9_9STRA|nr:unnamed protein product [Cylindrotheca closterium]